MFFAQITCVCSGGWRLIWNLPTVQLFSGFLHQVTGKRLELWDPCPPVFPCCTRKKKNIQTSIRFHTDETFQLNDENFSHRHDSGKWPLYDEMPWIWLYHSWRLSERFLSSFYTLTLPFLFWVLYGFPVGSLFWLPAIACPFFTQMWGIFGLRGTSPV